jgi:23S rRNA pseudouridine1911/1915/1917 synthase
MIEILYEDDFLIVLNKPAGMATLSAPSGIPSLSEELVLMRPELSDISDNGIAHRLDNDTSGIICVGKSVQSYKNLRTQFSDNKVSKHYRALVLGSTPDFDEIDAPLAHHPRKKTKMVVCESVDRAFELKARKAHTRYEVVQRYAFAEASYTLLDVTITTGVRHQIRAHLAWKGFPLAGDRLYQNAKKRAEDMLPLKRHFLHASKLELDHPSTGKRMIFECPLPKDLTAVLPSPRGEG